MATREDHYTFHSIDQTTGGVVESVNGDHMAESASTIKSPIGALALIHALNGGDSIEKTFSITYQDIPKRASTIFRSRNMIDNNPAIKQTSYGFQATLGTLIRLNIANSDATSTTKLIEYLGGKDRINNQLGMLGLNNTVLVTDVIDFDELSSPDTTPRIGITTAEDMANYYLGLRRRLGDRLGHKVTSDYIRLHGETTRARLFSRDTPDLPERIRFFHKTGSIFDFFDDGSGQAIIADAGLLRDTSTGKDLAVAAFLSSVRSSLRGINTEFSCKNQDMLGIHLDNTNIHREGELATIG